MWVPYRRTITTKFYHSESLPVLAVPWAHRFPSLFRQAQAERRLSPNAIKEKAQQRVSLVRMALPSLPSMLFTIPQNLFINDSTTFTVVKCNDDAVSVQHLRPLLDAALADRILGISATYDTNNCQLSSIALSTLSWVLVVNISDPARHVPQDVKRRIARGRGLIQDRLLPEFQKYAFMMDHIAVALYLDLSIRIDDAVDMISVSNDGRQSLQALMNAMGGEVELEKKNVQSLFFDTSKSSAMDPTAKVALKAWAAYRAATLPHMSSRFESLPRINTKIFQKAVRCLVNLSVAILTRRKKKCSIWPPWQTFPDMQIVWTL